jgi:hypothetical protein
MIRIKYPELSGKMTSMQELQYYLDKEYPNECQVIMKNQKIIKPIAIIGVLDLQLPTTHWTVLLDNIYIDSFGLVPPSDVLNQIIKDLDYMNLDKFQRFDSSLCGIYYLYMIYVYKVNPQLLNATIKRM